MATSQRAWRAACPNCGAPVEFASAASASAVCSYCRSTLLRDGETLRKIGLSAELFDDYSPLQLGAGGRYAGAVFTVVGRLQIGYAEGSWNEWHVLFDSGSGDEDAPPRSGWLSEDNGSFVLSFEAPLQEPAPAPEALQVGAQQLLAGLRWQVASKQEATLLAAEGELPHPPRLQQRFWVADLRNAQGEVGTLDYADPAAPSWSIGRAVALTELAMTGLREASGKALAAQALPCPNCGAALTPRLENTRSIVCAQCQSVVDISQGVGADLAHYRQEMGMQPQIPLGTTGQLAASGGSPQPWQVVGYLERCDIPESADDEQTFWREYLLYNPMDGFAFLVDTEEGWSIVRPITGAPKPGNGGAVVWQDKSFAQRWTYTAKVTHVLGEFYWRVKRDERALVSDYESRLGSRTELLGREQTGNEVTWSHGRTVDAEEVRRAFALPDTERAALRRDVGGSTLDQGRLLRNIVIAVVLVALLFALLRACSRDDCQRYKDSYGESSAEYQQCRRASHGGGVFIPGAGGGSYGGYSSGGGGHK
ncbi:MAG: DUF4178 domain-containing protein [Burkholderiaceae bacterium]